MIEIDETKTVFKSIYIVDGLHRFLIIGCTLGGRKIQTMLNTNLKSGSTNGIEPALPRGIEAHRAFHNNPLQVFQLLLLTLLILPLLL